MVDAPGKTKIKIVDISVILKDTINLKIVFYRFFNTKRILRTVNFYLKTRFKKISEKIINALDNQKD
jgi:hypothetical protein